MYYKTSFDLSNDAKTEILDYYKDAWQNYFEHRLEFLPQNWLFSLAGREIRQYLSKLNLFPFYTGINVFLSNTEKSKYTNPHVDVLHGSTLRPILSRFNIKCKGDSDTMHWWNCIKWGSGNLVRQKFTSFRGINYESYAIPGNSIEDRYNFLGKPFLSIKDVLTPSAILNTEYAHSLYIPAGPRVVVSVGFDITFNKIIDNIHGTI